MKEIWPLPKYVVGLLVLALLVLHQDYWQWNDATLDFGFMPRAITYHAGISILASILWIVVTQFAWPPDLAEPSGEEDAAQ